MQDAQSDPSSIFELWSGGRLPALCYKGGCVGGGGSREQGAGSREQGAGSREQGRTEDGGGGKRCLQQGPHPEKRLRSRRRERDPRGAGGSRPRGCQ